jgi:hypothetical protein
MSEHVTPDAGHGHDHHHEPAAPAFSEAEMAEFQKSDIGAGGAVVVLMTAIFTVGLLLYGVVAVIVARNG